MHALLKSLALLLVAAAAGSNSPALSSPLRWEKVYDVGPNDRVYAVAAVGRDQWFLALERAIATKTKGNVERHRTTPRQIEGFFVASPTSVYAFGDGELVVHFDGKAWTEEHVGPPPPTPRRRGMGAPDLLYSAYFSDSTLVAVGPSLAMVKQPDGSWAKPIEDQRRKLCGVGGSGPAISRPSRCDLAGWHWLGKGRGFFYCHDRRAFMWDSGKLTAKGSIPRKCYDSLNSIGEDRGELYAVCNSSTIWRSRGEAWQRVDEPKEKGPEDIEFVATADGCLFVTGPRAVWRSCP